MEDKYIGIFLIIIVIPIFITFIKKVRSEDSKKSNNIEKYDSIEIWYDGEENVEQKLPYHFKYLLTKNEWEFYKKLKITSDKYNLHILSKVRLADLVEVDNYLQGNGFNKYFSKIMAKHVDFVLCNPNNLAVRFILELDDSSHNASSERAERDDFVDKVLIKCGYKVVHTYGNANLDELFERLLK